MSINTANAIVLGQGGQGIVRRILASQGTVVFKEDLVPCVDPKRYLQEMTIAAELRGCPNVVQYYAVVVKRTDPHSDVMMPCGWLMEDLGDVTLHKWIRNMAFLSTTRTVSDLIIECVADVARGLQSMHQRGFVHMDVKLKL